MEIIDGEYCYKSALMRREIHIQDTSCVLYGYGEETIDHLSAECTIVRAIWWHVCMWTKIPVMVDISSFPDVKEMIDRLKGSTKWKNVFVAHAYGALWRKENSEGS
ncbi:hypothetical protein Hdeb2414_s0024g00652181 [Helianthus debilis subsp. tardiflorus]